MFLHYSEEFKDREDLVVDALYWSENDEMFFFTPGGLGGYWYETKEEAEEQHGNFSIIRHVPGING